MDADRWVALKGLFSRTFASSLHFAISSVGADGAPMVTPVATVFLEGPGRAYYFELYATGLGQRLSRDPRVSILAVDSGKGLWLRSLLGGRFLRAPAVRLVGTAAAESRPSTERERARLVRRLGFARHLPGGRLLWPDVESEAGLRVRVRDVTIERIDWIRFGPMEVLAG